VPNPLFCLRSIRSGGAVLKQARFFIRAGGFSPLMCLAGFASAERRQRREGLAHVRPRALTASRIVGDHHHRNGGSVTGGISLGRDFHSAFSLKTSYNQTPPDLRQPAMAVSSYLSHLFENTCRRP
jgi:hypothetical protein